MKRGRTQQWVWNEGEQHLMPPMVFMTPSSPPPPTMIPTTHLLSSTCQKFSQSPPFKTKSKAPACLVKVNLFSTMRETFKESPSAPAAATCWGIIHLKRCCCCRNWPVSGQYSPSTVTGDQYLPCMIQCHASTNLEGLHAFYQYQTSTSVRAVLLLGPITRTVSDSYCYPAPTQYYYWGFG